MKSAVKVVFSGHHFQTIEVDTLTTNSMVQRKSVIGHLKHFLLNFFAKFGYKSLRDMWSVLVTCEICQSMMTPEFFEYLSEKRSTQKIKVLCRVVKSA